MLEAALLVVFPILVAFAGISDLLTMKIPNHVSILLIIGFGLVGLAAGLSVADWGNYLLGGLVVFVPCFAMFALGWVGGGDAKVASAIALWFGFGADLVTFVVLTAFLGMFLTLGLLFFKNMPILPAFMTRIEWITRLHDPRTGIPYGIAIAVAALIVYPETFWFSMLG
ncbi:A24 family peptidase [Roseibium sp.]|uniref:A24 family peptidase n=1 Tax=Roseibium sp. TaxID=1936156 RepID=UPI003A97C0C7